MELFFLLKKLNGSVERHAHSRPFVSFKKRAACVFSQRGLYDKCVGIGMHYRFRLKSHQSLGNLFRTDNVLPRQSALLITTTSLVTKLFVRDLYHSRVEKIRTPKIGIGHLTPFAICCHQFAEQLDHHGIRSFPASIIIANRRIPGILNLS